MGVGVPDQWGREETEERNTDYGRGEITVLSPPDF